MQWRRYLKVGEEPTKTILLTADQQGRVDADEGKSNRATEMNMVQLLLQLRPYQQDGAEDDF